jgi:hypothetical protein
MNRNTTTHAARPVYHPWGHNPVVVTILTLAALLAILEFGLRLPQRAAAAPESQRAIASPHDERAASNDGSRAVEVDVNVQQPRDGDLVDQFTEVVYKVTGHIPSGSRPILLVRDPFGQYWSWGSSSNHERRIVQLGMPPDHGRRFEIGILIGSEEMPPGVPTQVRPSGFYRSITVTRR